MKQKIIDALNNSISVKQALLKLAPQIEKATELLLETCNNKGKVLLFGNGGSATDAQHLAAELLVRFNKERKALPAIALTTNNSIITACANDFGYDQVFKRQIEALAQKGDCAIAISTSGQSNSVIIAAEEAKSKGCKVISLIGNMPTPLTEISNLTIAIPSDDTARIQEAHITIGHIICQLVEDAIISDQVSLPLDEGG